MHGTDVSWVLAAVCGFFAQLIIFLRWIYRRMRDDEIYRAFVRDMATNHLPHLYHAVGQICGKLGLQIEEPPPIQFVDLRDGNGRYRR